ncbi:LamG domain-containing protein [Candidatus Albibeggiatoa sp. nov. BB20]|uniref:LamG domain-containing protein n=1 Tax=Candidatus Albibeggiatoa sp. nov. BB20 TaxID=3162723 RepID=UPI0033657ABA
MLNKTSTLVLTSFLGFVAVGNAVADLNDGLVAYYPFDGNAEDASGNGNDGTEYGDLSYVTGQIGQAVQFDGQDHHINIGNLLKNQCQFTFSIWINIDKIEIDRPEYFGIFGQQDFSYPFAFNDYNFYVGNNQNYRSFGSSSHWGDGKYFDSRVIHPLSTNEWHLITQTYDGNILSQFDNGILVNSIEVQDKCIDNDFDFLIGRTAAYPGYLYTSNFSGLADDFRIYNRALSNTEIQQLHCQENASCKPLSVDIAGFSGKFDTQSTVLTWTELSEHLGFNIYRAEQQNGKYINATKLNNSLYSNQGKSDEYTFIDDSVVAGKAYYYGLESIDLAGEVIRHMDDIISITTE